MDKYRTYACYGGDNAVTENTLEEALQDAKETSYREGCVVYVTQVVARVTAEQPIIEAQIEFVATSNLIEQGDK